MRELSFSLLGTAMRWDAMRWVNASFEKKWFEWLQTFISEIRNSQKLCVNVCASTFNIQHGEKNADCGIFYCYYSLLTHLQYYNAHCQQQYSVIYLFTLLSSNALNRWWKKNLFFALISHALIFEFRRLSVRLSSKQQNWYHF